MTKTTVELPVALMRQVRQAALDRGIAMKDVLIQALQNFFNPAKTVKNKSEKIKWVTFKGDGIRPDLDESDWSKIRELSYGDRA